MFPDLDKRVQSTLRSLQTNRETEAFRRSKRFGIYSKSASCWLAPNGIYTVMCKFSTSRT